MGEVGTEVIMIAESKEMHFFRVERKFQEIILKWFEAEHVKEFYYGDGLQNTLRNLELYCQGVNNNGEYSFDHWIAYMGDEPFGFLMTSPVEGPYDEKDDYDKWYVEGKSTYTLDLLIGPEKFIGKGLAHRMIQEFILDKFSDADFFIIDPGKTNKKAIHVYEKSGFKTVGEFCPAYDPIPHLMMRLEVGEMGS